MPRYKKEFTCDFCNSIFTRPPSQVRGKNKFCNNKCRSFYLKVSQVGANNPNFGKRWSQEKRAIRSTMQKQVMQSAHSRYQAGKANRGKKIDAETKLKMSISRLGRPGKRHSQKSKDKIGQASKDKWTDEYKKSHRKKMEDSGHWIPDKFKSDRVLYYNQSNWINRMFDIVDKQRLSLFGVWHYKNNKNGLVRDHKYSRASGFRNGVFPEILRHPCNCRLISHAENLRNAHSKNGLFEDVITLEELFTQIENYKDIWDEQEICIMLIYRYKNGEKWERKEVV